MRAIFGIGLLTAIVLVLDPAAIASQIRAFEAGWMVAALALGALQFGFSAERWRRTSVRLGVPLGRRRALAEYWLAGFANQALPGGVLGDANRAWRHSRSTGRTAPAVHAVVLERASGQVVVAAVLAGVLVLTAPGRQLLAQIEIPPLAWAASMHMLVVASIVGSTLAALVALIVAVRSLGSMPWLRRLLGDARTALLSQSAWPSQLLLSLAAVAACCAMFACAGQMIGAAMPISTLLAVAPAVLVSMLIPITIAGWGLRELVAAGIWALLGMPAAEGVAVSIAYGLVCLLASLPGAAVGVIDAAPRRT